MINYITFNICENELLILIVCEQCYLLSTVYIVQQHQTLSINHIIQTHLSTSRKNIHLTILLSINIKVSGIHFQINFKVRLIKCQHSNKCIPKSTVNLQTIDLGYL